MSLGALLIRADASVAIGTGHVMRCLALAQAWQDAGGRVVFVTAGLAEWLQQRLTAEGMEVVAIEAGLNEKQESVCLEQIVRTYKASWAVVDGYHFNDRYLTELKARGLNLLVLDDSGLNECCAVDFVLNPNSNANVHMYPKCGSGTTLLLGTKYALLRREFTAWRGWERQTGTKVRRLLTTMGGSDPDDITDLALQAIGMLKDKDIDHTVITGGSNRRLQNLKTRAMSISERIRVLPTVSDVPRLMAESDLAITAAGGTLWELMYMS